jgi:hypothetical protein
MFDWSSIVFKINGQRYYKIKDIDFGDGMEQVLVYGMGKNRSPVGRTRGKYVPKPVAITFMADAAEAVRADLGNLAGTRGLSAVAVNILLQRIETDEGPTITVEINGCTLTENANTDSEGADPSEEKLTFQPLTIKRNGRALYDTSAPGA